MKRTKILLVATFLTCLAASSYGAKNDPIIWNIKHLQEVKKCIQSKDSTYKEAYRMLIGIADHELTQRNPTVMDKPKAPASGDKHDYTSLSRYFWPNPQTADGLPYIQRDGESNPELNDYDRNRLGDMCNSVCHLSMAYYLSGNKDYSQKAVSILRTWFLDPATKMNPNLNYSQIAPGHFDGKGRSFGLIDAYSFMGLIDAIALLNNTKQIPPKDYVQIKDWFAELTEWMIHSENGITESKSANNHSIAYDVQVTMYAYFGGKYDIAKNIINEFPTKRLAAQIQPDGSQPRELTRTIAFHYSVYNLVHMMDMCDLASKMGIDLYNSNNGAIDRAFGWLIPFMGKPETFPFQQINDWRTVETSLAQQLLRATAYSKNQNYGKLYQQFRAIPEDPLFTLLYVN